MTKKRNVPRECIVAPANNGIIVKVGCSVFVALEEERAMLTEYLDGKIPKGIEATEADAFQMLNGDCTDAVAVPGPCCEQPKEPVYPIPLPSFLQRGCFEFSSAVLIIKARNGYVVRQEETGPTIAKTAKEVQAIVEDILK